MAATRAASQPEQRIFDRSGCALLVNTAEPSAPPVFSEVETSVCVRITRSPAGVLLGSGSKDEGMPKGAKHDHQLQVLLPSGECLLKARLHSGTQHCRLGSHTYVWTPDAAATATTDGSTDVVSRGFQFHKASDCAGLAEAMAAITRSGAAVSQFDSTRADSSADNYFHYYGQLMFQQNMLSDSVRTQLYRRAVFENQMDFRGKVVVDVGCGSGILSFFAAQAGARKVYAIEASRAADDAELLVSVGHVCKLQPLSQCLVQTLQLHGVHRAGENKWLRRHHYNCPWQSRGSYAARGLRHHHLGTDGHAPRQRAK